MHSDVAKDGGWRSEWRRGEDEIVGTRFDWRLIYTREKIQSCKLIPFHSVHPIHTERSALQEEIITTNRRRWIARIRAVAQNRGDGWRRGLQHAILRQIQSEARRAGPGRQRGPVVAIAGIDVQKLSRVRRSE